MTRGRHVSLTLQRRTTRPAVVEQDPAGPDHQ
jgi:hypothetical protein